MNGELIVSFCERGKSGSPKAVELWGYPDGTLNLVVAKEAAAGAIEHSFPCTHYQLQRVLENRPLELFHAGVSIVVERCEDLVCAQVSCALGGWKQCIPATVFEEMLDQSILMSRTTLV